MFDDLWDTIKEGAEIICSWADDCSCILESLMKELATIINEEKSSIFKSLYKLVLTKSNSSKIKSNNRKLDWYTSGFL